MGKPALAIVDEAAGEEAAQQTVNLTVIEADAAAEAGEAVVTIEIGEAAVATGGVALVVIGLAALAYHLYKNGAPANPELVTQCPLVQAAHPLSVSTGPSSSATASTASTRTFPNPERKCGPDDCTDAKKAIRDLLKGGKGTSEKRSLKDRLDDLRKNEEGQPY